MFVTIQPMSSHVVVLALDAVVPLDLAIPAQVFGDLRRGAVPRPRLRGRARPVRDDAGFDVVAQAGLEALATADTVLVPGFAPHLRVAGRRCSTRCGPPRARRADGLDLHRRVRARRRRRARRPPRDHPLARRRRARGPLPAVNVEPDVLYIDEGDVLTSAGVAAGLDLCLHILRSDHGAALASTIARRIVVPPHRDGGQAQYVERPVAEQRRRSLAATRAWALERLHEPLTVRALAAHAHVSERTFARRFRAETGVPVLRWLLAQRVDAARAALESTDASDRRDRPPLRLRHRGEPAQALPPRHRDDADRLPARVHGPPRSSGRMNHSTAMTARRSTAGANQTDPAVVEEVGDQREAEDERHAEPDRPAIRYWLADSMMNVRSLWWKRSRWVALGAIRKTVEATVASSAA